MNVSTTELVQSIISTNDIVTQWNPSNWETGTQHFNNNEVIKKLVLPEV